jgi:DNA-binding transcriptional regulator YiaG
LANIGALLKEEITRLARKELRIETQGLKKASAQYRSDIAALKRRTAELEHQLARLGKTLKTSPVANENPVVDKKSRITAKGFKSLRQRLGLTAAEIGTFLDVTAQTIYNWEAGNASPRAQQMSRIAVLRGMGKREVQALLQEFAK